MSDFPFPLASYIHKCAVNNKCLYFTEHETIWKKLKTKKTKFLKILRSIHVIQGIKQSYSTKSKNYNQKTDWRVVTEKYHPIRVINKIGRPRSGNLICVITSMITDRIGRHKGLLPINHNFNKICDIIGHFLNQNTRNSKFCFASSEKKAT